MTAPLLVLINGMPCTGKTTLARFLAKRLSLPHIGKDGIKETLVEQLGYSDVAHSRALGALSFELIYYFLEAQLKAGRSLLAEGNFHADMAGPRLSTLKNAYECQVLQILCRAEPDVLLERYRRRLTSGERHPGHLDSHRAGEFSKLVQRGEWEPVPVDGELVIVDTTTFESIDYEGLAARISMLLPPAA